MYKKDSKIIHEKTNLVNYVEGSDIYNSELLYKLLDPDIPRITYEITVYEYRPDLIAKDFYGDVKYQGLLVYQAKLPLNGYTRGTKIRLIPKSTIDSIITGL